MLKQKKLNLGIILNTKGLSIIEVLVAAGLASIVALGIATMVQNMMIEQKKGFLLKTIADKKTEITNTLRDNVAFNRTLSDTTNAGGTAADSTNCILQTTACNAVAATAPRKLIVRGSNDTVLYNLLDWAGAGTAGFTETGAPCNTFSSGAGTGTDACPISYKIAYRYICQTGATCRYPTMAIVARLMFNPSTTGVLNRYRGLIDSGNLTTFNPFAADTAADRNGKFDVVVVRSTSSKDRHFQLAYSVTAGGAAGGGIQQCGVAGAGVCTTTLSTYPTGANGRGTFREVSNLFSLVTVTGGVFALSSANENGDYSCTIQGQAWSTGGFTLEFYNATDAISLAQATTTAGQWSGSTAIVKAEVPLTAGKNYTVRQMCSAVPPTISGYDPSACSLGMRVENYTAASYDYVTISCAKIE